MEGGAPKMFRLGKGEGHLKFPHSCEQLSHVLMPRQMKSLSLPLHQNWDDCSDLLVSPQDVQILSLPSTSRSVGSIISHVWHYRSLYCPRSVSFPQYSTSNLKGLEHGLCTIGYIHKITNFESLRKN